MQEGFMSNFIVTIVSEACMYNVPYTRFKFPAGELHTRFEDTRLGEEDILKVVVSGNIYNSDMLMELCLLKDCLDQVYTQYIELSINYLPYARQDRVCSFGDSFSLRAFARMINAMQFDKVTVWDAHNETIAMSLINNLVIRTQAEVISQQKHNGNLPSLKNLILVAPDKGASVKISAVSKALCLSGFLQGEKKRDPATGQLTGFDVNCADFQGRNVLIVDDICDGGGTFIGLAEVIKQRNCGKLYLYVTHGIFSKGKDELNRYFDGIYTPYTFKGETL
jgi:ribose-phosphate pyrophosphokinase